jgi:hypothetical protein
VKEKVGTNCLGNGCQKYRGSTKEYSVNGNVWDGDDDDPGCGQEPAESQGGRGRRGEEWTVGCVTKGGEGVIGWGGQLECSNAMQGADAWSNENCRQGCRGLCQVQETGCAFASLRLEDLAATGEW